MFLYCIINENINDITAPLDLVTAFVRIPPAGLFSRETKYMPDNEPSNIRI